MRVLKLALGFTGESPKFKPSSLPGMVESVVFFGDSPKSRPFSFSIFADIMSFISESLSSLSRYEVRLRFDELDISSESLSESSPPALFSGFVLVDEDSAF